MSSTEHCAYRNDEATVPPIRLTTIGSACVQLRAVPAVLAAGGVQIESVSHEGTVLEKRLTLTLTAEEAALLVEQITDAALGAATRPEPPQTR